MAAEPSNSADQGDGPWYREGLRFTCTECGDCCTGEPGYVWVNKAEIREMADTQGVSVEEFEEANVRWVGVRKSLREHANGDCVLLDPKTRKCTVYQARPRQCRTWPFWDSNLKSPEAWAEACEACPGSGKGKLHTVAEIQTQRGVIRV